MKLLLISTLYLISDPCCSGSKTETGHLGETVTISCSYPEEYERRTKTFYRQDGHNVTALIRTTETLRDRFSISDNTGSRALSVRISDVREDDGGVYYCGVEGGGGSISYLSLYTQIHLQVTGPVPGSSTTTTTIIIPVCVCVALLLIGGSALIFYRRRCRRTQESASSSDVATKGGSNRVSHSACEYEEIKDTNTVAGATPPAVGPPSGSPQTVYAEVELPSNPTVQDTNTKSKPTPEAHTYETASNTGEGGAQLMMKILLILTLYLVPGQVDSVGVMGYEGGSFFISCKYDYLRYTNHTKYFCRLKGSQCTDKVLSKTQNPSEHEGRVFFVEGDPGLFNVHFKNISQQDNGTYRCGVEGEPAQTTDVTLKVKEGERFPSVVYWLSAVTWNWFPKADPCCGKILIRRTHPGETFTFTCSYPQEYRDLFKYLYKVTSHSLHAVIYTLGRSAKTERLSLSDHPEGNLFNVSLSNVTEEDGGVYLCGVQGLKKEEKSLYHYSLFNEIQLKVEDPRTSPGSSVIIITITVCVCVVLLLIGGSALIYKLRRNRAEGSPDIPTGPIHTTNDDYENDPPGNQNFTSLDPVYQNQKSTRNQSDSAYQTLNPHTNQSDSAYQVLNRNTNQTPTGPPLSRHGSAAGHLSVTAGLRIVHQSCGQHPVATDEGQEDDQHCTTYRPTTQTPQCSGSTVIITVCVCVTLLLVGGSALIFYRLRHSSVSPSTQTGTNDNVEGDYVVMKSRLSAWFQSIRSASTKPTTPTTGGPSDITPAHTYAAKPRWECTDPILGSDIGSCIDKTGSGGVVSIEVIGFTGGRVIIICRHAHYGLGIKYICKPNENTGCENRTETEPSKTRTRNHRTDLFDDTQQNLMVSIRQLSLQDSGHYQCGEIGAWYHNFILRVFRDPCCSEPNTETGYLGETVTINCSYPDQHERDIKIFYRQDGQRLTPVISTTETQRDRFSISDTRGSRVLRVRIRDVREGDGGVYYCGVQDGIWDLSYYSLYTETHLQVTGSSVTTIFIISVCVCVVLLLIGGSALVFYRLRTQGPGNLVRVHGIMNALKYQDILKQNLVASARKLKMGRHWVFQQDNDPKHMAKSTQKWFTTHRIKLLPWPSQSPDLNPIENLWGSLYVHAQTRTPNTADGDYENDPGHRNISIGPLYQSLDPNTNQSESVYQSLNPNQSDSAYQTLNPNTNQSDSAYQTLNPNTNQSESAYQSLNPNQSDSLYQSLILEKAGLEFVKITETEVQNEASPDLQPLPDLRKNITEISNTVDTAAGPLRNGCLKRGGVMGFDVIGVSGGRVIITCRHHIYGPGIKYTCKLNEHNGCENRTETEPSKTRTQNHRTDLFDDTQQNLMVSITQLSLQDTGRYQCGEAGVWNHNFILQVIRDPCCSEPNTETGYLGETVTINCSYPDRYEKHTKTFYRQDGQRLTPVISTTETQRDRFSISEDRGSRVLSVRIRDVREGDGGVYYCAVQDGVWELRYLSLYTETRLQVTGPIVKIIVCVCVALLLLVSGGLALMFLRRMKAKDSFSLNIKKTENKSDVSPAVCVYEEIKDIGPQSDTEAGPIYATIPLSTKPSDPLSSVYATAQLPTDSSNPPNSVYATAQLPTDSSNPPNSVYATAQLPTDSSNPPNSVYATAQLPTDSSNPLNSVYATAQLPTDSSNPLNSVYATAQLPTDSSNPPNSVYATAQLPTDSSNPPNSVYATAQLPTDSSNPPNSVYATAQLPTDSSNPPNSVYATAQLPTDSSNPPNSVYATAQLPTDSSDPPNSVYATAQLPTDSSNPPNSVYATAQLPTDSSDPPNSA
ncbi:hypothetical protein NFI96_023136 [Prochilodus magdalenae]|nr:hypothetical protein NFI96_023136 [Prochilodus magdalenae]